MSHASTAMPFTQFHNLCLANPSSGVQIQFNLQEFLWKTFRPMDFSLNLSIFILSAVAAAFILLSLLPLEIEIEPEAEEEEMELETEAKPA